MIPKVCFKFLYWHLWLKDLVLCSLFLFLFIICCFFCFLFRYLYKFHLHPPCHPWTLIALLVCGSFTPKKGAWITLTQESTDLDSWWMSPWGVWWYLRCYDRRREESFSQKLIPFWFSPDFPFRSPLGTLQKREQNLFLVPLHLNMLI